MQIHTDMKNGNYAGDVMFLGDDFFGLHRDKIERIDDDE